MRVHDFKTWYNTIQNSISSFEIKEFLSIISSAIFENWSLRKSTFIKHDQLDKIFFCLSEIFFFLFIYQTFEGKSKKLNFMQKIFRIFFLNLKLKS